MFPRFVHVSLNSLVVIVINCGKDGPGASPGEGGEKLGFKCVKMILDRNGETFFM